MSCGQDALDHPAIERPGERHFDIVLRMHAEQQHRAGKHHLVIDAKRVHAAPRRRDEAMDVACLDQFAPALMADAPADALQREPGRNVQQRVGAGESLVLRLADLAQHVIVDQVDDLRPEMVLGDMRVDIDDEVVVVAGGGLARRMRQHVAHVRRAGNVAEWAGALLPSLPCDLFLNILSLVAERYRTRKEERFPGRLPN